jgi:hypothetical protein
MIYFHFSFCHLPEIEEEFMLKQVHINSPDGTPEAFSKQYRCIFGFVAQTAYVCVAFFLRYSWLSIHLP